MESEGNDDDVTGSEATGMLRALSEISLSYSPGLLKPYSHRSPSESLTAAQSAKLAMAEDEEFTEMWQNRTARVTIG